MENTTPKGWVKNFSDGTIELGFDHLIDEGKASWRNGRLNDIISVDIFENGYKYTLIRKESSLKEWWQGNEYHSRFIPGATVPGELQRRFIQFQLSKEDIGKYLHIIKLPNCYQVVLKDNSQGALCQLDKETYTNKWLTLNIVPGLERPGIQIRARKG